MISRGDILQLQYILALRDLLKRYMGTRRHLMVLLIEIEIVLEIREQERKSGFTSLLFLRLSSCVYLIPTHSPLLIAQSPSL